MLTFISFLILIAGGINWFSVGLLQFDFIAGIFGTQASILSRIFYILVGISTCWIIVATIMDKGKLNIFEGLSKKKNHRDILADTKKN